jgi:hypothetical protein
MKRVLLVLWFGACFWVLASSLYGAAVIDVKDGHVGLIFWMTLLTFPSGFLVIWATQALTDPYGAYFSVAWKFHPEFLVFVWVCFVIVGYVQWFVVPALLMRHLTTRSRADAP